MWRILHVQSPNGRQNRLVCYNVAQVWIELGKLKITGKYPNYIRNKKVLKEMNELWGSQNFISWLNLYNQNISLKNEHFMVWDVETDNQLL